MLPEDVLECGYVGAFRMAALLRLFELLRVAEQHEALSGGRNRKRIRQ